MSVSMMDTKTQHCLEEFGSQWNTKMWEDRLSHARDVPET